MLILPIRTDYRRRTTPWVNYAIIAANILLYVLGYNGSTPQHLQRIYPWILEPQLPELWQFFSCTFLHANFMHLFGNMIFLWVFGNAINDKFGHVGYLAFYLAGGVLAGVGYLLLAGNAPCLGASGAIAAVAGAYLVLLPRTNITLVLWVYFIIPFEVSSLYFIVIQFVFEIFMTLKGWAGPASGGVAYAAHASGYLFGIALSFALLASRLLVRDDLDCLHLIKHWMRREHYRRMAAAGYDPFRRPTLADAPAAGRTVETLSTTTAESPTAAIRQSIADAIARHDLPAATADYLAMLEIDNNAVLPRQQQLDIANQLMSTQQYPAAAHAYERFLEHYPRYEHLADIRLMLGLLYGRYLHKPELAEPYLKQAVNELMDPTKIKLAAAELKAASQHVHDEQRDKGEKT